MQQINKRDILQELNKRDALNSNQQRELYQLELGQIGEERILKWVQEYGEAHWTIMQNVWLSHYGTFECDFILFTDHKIYLFEIKNYSRKFELRNGQCYLGGEKIGHNPISQGQKVFVNFETVMRQSYYQVPLETAVIFAGEHCEVRIHDKIQDVKVLQLNQVREYIWKIAAEEKFYHGDSIDVPRIQHILEKNRGENYYLPKPISAETESRIRKGVMCSNCGSFDINPSKAIISCPHCRTREPRENAIVRTICEYGVINFDKDLDIAQLFDFFEGTYSRETLRKYINKHFRLKSNYKRRWYVNDTVPFKDMLPILNLPIKQLQIYTDY